MSEHTSERWLLPRRWQAWKLSAALPSCICHLRSSTLDTHQSRRTSDLLDSWQNSREQSHLATDPPLSLASAQTTSQLEYICLTQRIQLTNVHNGSAKAETEIMSASSAFASASVIFEMILSFISCSPITTLLLDPFNGLYSRTIWVSRYQKGKTSLDVNETRDDGVLGWQWHQLGHMQTICTSLQTDNDINTSHHWIFYRPDALPDAQPTVSKHWRQHCCWCSIKHMKRQQQCQRSRPVYQQH